MIYLIRFLIGLAIGAAITLLIILLTLWSRKKNNKTKLPAVVSPKMPVLAATFSITRKEIADYILTLNNPDITIVERPRQPQLPMSLKYKGKTFAMLHGTDEGVLMIVRLSDDDAETLAPAHPEVCRASFPKGPNWYCVPVDGTFSDKESVCTVLANAYSFVKKHPNTPAQAMA